VTTLGAGRAAMRLQKGLQGEELNIAPSYLIVPATQENLAYQFTSANYVPAQATNINEFRAGGRTAVEPIVEALLDASSTTAWYLAANTGAVDTVEYCFLDGAEGPMVESEVGFEVDGISYKCREDFAAKAIDYRGLFKNAGA
jgi:phage major head subunit gpT-like protein